MTRGEAGLDNSEEIAGAPGSLRWIAEVAAAFDAVCAGEDAGDGFGVSEVLFQEDSGGQGVAVVLVEDGDGALEDDDAVVEMLIDEVDGAAGDFRAVVEGLLLGVEAGKGWQKGGVNVEDPVGEGGDELRRQEAHIAGEADEVDLMVLKAADDFGVVFGAGAAFGDEERGGDAERAGRFEAWGIGYVGDDDGDPRAGQAALVDGAVDGEEVRAPAGEKNA